MADLVKSIADYAHSINPNFKIWANNAEELLSNSTYFSSLDGMFKENLYYTDHGTSQPASETSYSLSLLHKMLAAGKEVVAIEYVTGPDKVANVHAKADQDGIGSYIAHLDLNGIDYEGVRTADPHAGVYRYYDTVTHDHFYTSSAAEKAAIDANNPTYHYEGIAWSTPAKGADTTDVFRFYDAKTNAHFFTTSEGERDFVIKTSPDYHYEGVAFQAYGQEGGPNALTLERFYNSDTHVHHYSASQAETDWINAGGAGAGWHDEGHGFTVHAPDGSMLTI
jgi:hypothetical protein